jgi:hypothetical protein
LTAAIIPTPINVFPPPQGYKVSKEIRIYCIVEK